jgi:hypothetical protein
MNGEYIFSQYNKNVQYTCKLKFIGKSCIYSPVFLSEVVINILMP